MPSGTMMPLLVMKLVFNTLVERSPFFIRPISSTLSGQINKSYIDPNLVKMFQLLDTYLSKDGGREWLAGSDGPTGADFMVSPSRTTYFPCFTTETSAVSIDVLPTRSSSERR